MNKIANYIKKNVAHPWSTFSNLAYIFLGALAVFQPGVEIFIAWLLIALGIASTGYHWVWDNCWHKADIVMIYYLFAVIGFWLLLGPYGIIAGFAAGGIAHYSFQHYSHYSRYIIGAFGVLCLIAFWLQSHKIWTDVVEVLMWFGLAFASSYVADNITIFKERENVYDGFHAVWHILTAVGIWYLIT